MSAFHLALRLKSKADKNVYFLTELDFIFFTFTLSDIKGTSKLDILPLTYM